MKKFLSLFILAAALSTAQTFTVVVVPDPQYLADNGSCQGAAAYNSLVQWAIDHRNDVVGGDVLNIKGFIQVGDTQDAAHPTLLTVGETRMADAFDLAYAANMFVVHAAGNHDYYNGGSIITDRNNIGHAWKTGGRWSPENLAAKYGSGINLGDGFTATFGGVYTDPVQTISSANAYYLLNFGARKVLAVAVEFYPRASVLQWVADLAALYPDREVWYTTHALISHLGALADRAVGGSPDAYSMGASPAATSGVEQWNGTASNIGLKTIPNMTLMTGGHFVFTPPTTGWMWQRSAATNNSGRVVQRLFSDWQGADLAPPTCTSVEEIFHLQLLVISPTTIKSYEVSTKNGKWVGASGVTGSATPIELFNQPFIPVTPLITNSVAPIQIFEVDGITQTNRVHILGMMFKQGDIANCAVPVIGGVALDTASYQCKSDTTWPDGSLKTARVAFISTLTPSQALTVSFTSGVPNNTGYLNQTDMLGFNGGLWDGQILVTANGQTVTRSAKTMLNALSLAYCQIEYDLQGPIATRVRVQDCTGTFAYDFGWHWLGGSMLDNGGSPFATTSQYASLHPIFDLTFIPSTNSVRIDAILENEWTERAQDQAYSLVIKVGSPLVSVYTQSTFTHIAKSNWRRTFWSGATPGHTRPDWNLPYLISTGLFPHYDMSSQVTSTINPAPDYNDYAASARTDVMGDAGMVRLTADNQEGAIEQGAAVRYFYLMSNCSTANCAKAWATLTGEIDTVHGLAGVVGGGGLWNAQGSIPIHSRESRSTGSYYCVGRDDKNATSATACGATVTPRGRGLSRDAHTQDGNNGTAFPVAPVGDWSNGGWSFDGCTHWLSYSFIPAVLVGDRYNLEELYNAANFCLTTESPDGRVFGQSGWWADVGIGIPTYRQIAWALQEVGKAIIAAPDGSSEKLYYTSKFKQNFEMMEGFRGLTGNIVLTPTSPKTTCSGYTALTSNAWDYGHCTIGQGVVPSLYSGTDGQCPINGDGLNAVDLTKGSWQSEPWFDWYVLTALGDLISKGFTYVSPVHANLSRRLIEWTQDPTANPYHIAMEVVAIRNGPGGQVTCVPTTLAGGVGDPYLTFAQMKDAIVAPYKTASNFTSLLANYSGCENHSYSLVARAAGTFLTTLTSGSYTGSGAWSWLSSNVPYFSNGCVANGDNQIKFALSPQVVINGGSLTSGATKSIGNVIRK